MIDEYIYFSKHNICVICGCGQRFNNTNINAELNPILSVKYILNTDNFTAESSEKTLGLLGENHIFIGRKKWVIGCIF